jgi:hypothetical protein
MEHGTSGVRCVAYLSVPHQAEKAKHAGALHGGVEMRRSSHGKPPGILRNSSSKAER